jgi:hypothetical protein
VRSTSISRRLLTLLFVLTASVSDGRTNEVERPLSLPQCFRIALDHNFDVAIARFNPEIQQHNLNAIYGAYEPTSAFAATLFQHSTSTRFFTDFERVSLKTYI